MDFKYSQPNPKAGELLSTITYEIEDNSGLKRPTGYHVNALEGSILVGFLYVIIDSIGATITVARIEKLYKGTGLGQLLFDRGIAEAKRRGLKTFSSQSASYRTDQGENAWKRLKERYKVIEEETVYQIQLV